jgi:hypothetical protein
MINGGGDARRREEMRGELFPKSGTLPMDRRLSEWGDARRKLMNGLIYLVGLIVVILAVLSFFGLR